MDGTLCRINYELHGRDWNILTKRDYLSLISTLEDYTVRMFPGEVIKTTASLETSAYPKKFSFADFDREFDAFIEHNRIKFRIETRYGYICAYFPPVPHGITASSRLHTEPQMKDLLYALATEIEALYLAHDPAKRRHLKHKKQKNKPDSKTGELLDHVHKVVLIGEKLLKAFAVVKSFFGL